MMNHRLRELALFAVVTALLTACGAKQNVASKSAAAYREAQAQGSAIASDGHGDHHAESADTAAVPSAPESPAQTGTAYAGRPRNEHGQHHAPASVESSPREHDSMPAHGAEHASAKEPAEAHSPMPGVSMPHHTMPHGEPRAATAAAASSGGMGRMHASATLAPDELDAASPISVAEASRAGVTKMMAHGEHAAEVESAPNGYTCPMHPEVTSATPGRCAKCGMDLVRKED